MRYHWVNHKKTGVHEISGGYMWCPKTNTNGQRIPYYEMMRTVEPGDIVFSYSKRTITHIGVVTSQAFEARKPTAFGASGDGWLDLGWMVLVEYEHVAREFSPIMHMDALRQLLPKKYSPIRPDGVGNQFYFATIPDTLGETLIALAGLDSQIVSGLQQMVEPAIARSHSRIAYEASLIQRLEELHVEEQPIPATTKQALIAARVGQGQFRNAVAQLEPECRVTRVDDLRFLRASHIKPWRLCSNTERLDGENGLMLTPTIDHLFDQGYISFGSNGTLIRASTVLTETWNMLKVPEEVELVKPFSSGQRNYLEYHRTNILRSTS
jgi:putative restriction endonuclease